MNMDMHAWTAWDRTLFLYLNQNWGYPLLDDLLLWISSEKPWFFLIGALLWTGWKYKNLFMEKFLFSAAISIAMTDLFCFRWVKPFFHRMRPCYQIEMTRLLEDSCGSNYGFPSNHAANSMALAIVILYLSKSPRWKIGWIFLFPLVVGLSRIYVGVHFPLDVLCGFFIGGFIGLGTAVVVDKKYLYFKKRCFKYTTE